MSQNSDIRNQDNQPSSLWALHFSPKWLTSPKLYMVLVLPSRHPFNLKHVVKVAKKMIQKNNLYFIANSNNSKNNIVSYVHNDLLWFPFEAGYYDQICPSLNFLQFSDDTLQKHYLFFVEIEKRWTFISSLAKSSSIAI